MTATEVAKRLQTVAKAGAHYAIVQLPNGQKHEVHYVELRGSDARIHVSESLNPPTRT